MECVLCTKTILQKGKSCAFYICLELTEQVIFQFMEAAVFLSFLPTLVFRPQTGGFNPLFPAKRHPSLGWSSFHTSPISLCPWTWELTKAPRMWDVIGR